MQVKNKPTKTLMKNWYKVIDLVDDIDEEMGNLFAGYNANATKITNDLGMVQAYLKEFKREYKNWLGEYKLGQHVMKISKEEKKS